MIDLYVLSVVAFFVILGILIYKDRKRVEIKYYLLYMRRTKKFRNLIDALARNSPRLWRAVSTVSIVVCFIVMAVGLFLIGNVVYQIYIGKIQQAAAQLILPTPFPTGNVGPGYIFIPFWTWIITIAFILIPHEFFHGVIARTEKIRLKSVGLLLFAIFPGAFVEPDERQLKKAKLITKLRIFCAGSFANFVTAGIFFLLVSFVIWPIITNPALSIHVTAVPVGTPAYQVGLRPNATITEINGKQIRVSYLEFLFTTDYTLNDIGQLKAGQVVTLNTDRGTYDVTIGEEPNTNRTIIGFNGAYSPIFKSQYDAFVAYIFPILILITLFSFFVGLVNILPIYPLDGGLVFQSIMEKFFKERSENIVKGVTYIMILIFAYLFIGPYI